VPTTAQDVSVVYGAKTFGYFETKPLRREGPKVWIDFIPPTFRAPIEFTLKFKDMSGKLITRAAGQRKYAPLKTNLLSSEAFIEGALSFNYALTNGMLQVGDKTTYVPILINKFGELVWYFNGNSDAQQAGLGAFTIQPIGHGEFIAFRSDHETHVMDKLIRLNARGESLQYFDFKVSIFAWQPRNNLRRHNLPRAALV
jgi:hypothetical protein